MKYFKSSSKGLCLTIAIACMFCVQSVQSKSIAKNRNDVFDALSQLETGLIVPGLDVWINEKTEQPVVNVGESIVFTMKSEMPAYYTLIYVDSKGGTSVLSPMNAANGASGSKYLVYPSQEGNSGSFTQVEPIGQDAIYLLASKKSIPANILGLSENEDYRDLGKDIDAIESLVAKINSQAGSNPLSVIRYTYAVESANTQYSTRSIRRKVNELEKVASESMNFNNINFEFNADQLTSAGKLELDGLGNALVMLEGENGQFPQVELIGHTDSIASEVYNFKLSAKRAESAKQYLVSEFGVPMNQIRTVGAGETVPIDSNDTDIGRAQNRRVELKVISVQ